MVKSFNLERESKLFGEAKYLRERESKYFRNIKYKILKRERVKSFRSTLNKF